MKHCPRFLILFENFLEETDVFGVYFLQIVLDADFLNEVQRRKIATAMAVSVTMTNKNDLMSLSLCIMHFEWLFFDGCNARIVDERHIPAGYQ